MKVVTSKIKEAINKVVKCSGFNDLIAITSMLGIKLSDGKLRFLTTDMNNTLCAVIDKVSGDDIDITVNVDKFSKLIAKTTSDTIEMSVKDDVLVVHANGTYKIPLISDEDGLVCFPDIVSNFESVDKWNDVKLTSIMQAYNINRAALAKTPESGPLMGYYCGDMVISTDSNVITFNDFKMFSGDFPDILISAKQMQLLSLFTEENIKVTFDTEKIVFYTEDYILEGCLMEGIGEFPVEETKAYLDEAFTSSCKVSRDVLLSVLDRLALFIEPYDKNGAYFTFSRTGINIHSKKDASVETVSYIESKDFKSFVCCVEVPILKEQVQSNPSDTIKIYYGNENALKIENGKVLQVIALLEDEELDN